MGHISNARDISGGYVLFKNELGKNMFVNSVQFRHNKKGP